MVVFLLISASVFLPAALLVYSEKGYREKLFFYLPLAAVFQLCLIAVLSAVLYKAMDYGWPKYLIVLVASTLLTKMLLKAIGHDPVFAPKRIHGAKALAMLAILSAIAIADNFLILGKQGVFEADTPYFRPPFTSDSQRNLILVNSLIREDGSPFLPGSEHAYQLFWHHAVALFVSLSETGGSYTLVSGATLFTSYMLFFVLFWFIYQLRPALFLRYRLLAAVAIIFVTHADAYNLFKSFIATGHLGIEADGSYFDLGKTYTHFSIKAVSATAPQHALFLIILAAYLATARRWMDRGWRSGCHRGIFWVLLFIASPVLWLLTIPFYALYEMFIYRVRFGYHAQALLAYATKAAGLLVLAFLACWLVLRIWPVDLFIRPGVGTVTLAFDSGVTILKDIPKTPIWLFQILGILGLFVLVLAALRLRKREFGAFNNPQFFLLASMLLAFHVILNHTEIRRHFSIVASMLAIPLAAVLLPSAAVMRKNGAYRFLIVLGAATAGLFHSYYVYAYIGKPTMMSSSVNWREYYCMNGLISAKYPHLPALSAVGGFVGGDLRFPTVMEVAPSFARPEDAYVHSKIPDARQAILAGLQRGESAVEHAGDLGIRLVVWGPLENEVWGQAIRDRTISEDRYLDSCGAVRLYRAP